MEFIGAAGSLFIDIMMESLAFRQYAVSVLKYRMLYIPWTNCDSCLTYPTLVFSTRIYCSSRGTYFSAEEILVYKGVRSFLDPTYNHRKQL